MSRLLHQPFKSSDCSEYSISDMLTNTQCAVLHHGDGDTCLPCMPAQVQLIIQLFRPISEIDLTRS